MKNIGGDGGIIYGIDRPLWYKGYFDKTFDENIITNTLNIYGVEHIVIGHTIVDDIMKMYA